MGKWEELRGILDKWILEETHGGLTVTQAGLHYCQVTDEMDALDLAHPLPSREACEAARSILRTYAEDLPDDQHDDLVHVADYLRSLHGGGAKKEG